MDRYKTIIDRVAAHLVDTWILTAIFFLLNYFILRLKLPVSGYIFFLVIFGFMFCSYFVFTHGKYGQTFGKWFCDIKVVDQRSLGHITIKQALFRQAPYFVLIPVVIYNSYFAYSQWLTEIRFANEFFEVFYENILLITLYSEILFYLQIIVVLKNKRRRAVHDLIAGTVVVRVTEKSAMRGEVRHSLGILTLVGATFISFICLRVSSTFQELFVAFGAELPFVTRLLLSSSLIYIMPPSLCLLSYGSRALNLLDFGLWTLDFGLWTLDFGLIDASCHLRQFETIC